jgi:hypothetical protein
MGPKTDRPETPESVRRALKSAYTASAEVAQTSKALLQSTTPLTKATKSPKESLEAVAKLASLVHSHTVRTALTCGPTASSPTATLSCIKELHEPLLPLVSEFQNISKGEYPAYYVLGIRRQIEGLFDTLVSFLGEVVEIACGDATVESKERLQYSGMMLHSCDEIQEICKNGPFPPLREKLRETEEMLKDALEEVGEIIESTPEELDDEDLEDGWNEPVEYTPDQKKFAEQVQSKLRLLTFLYKAISKRRLPASSTIYTVTLRPTLDTVHTRLATLSSTVDDLVSGITAQEEPMSLQLSLMQTQDEGRHLAHAVRVPLSGVEDGKEVWFDTWLEKWL